MTQPQMENFKGSAIFAICHQANISSMSCNIGSNYKMVPDAISSTLENTSDDNIVEIAQKSGGLSMNIQAISTLLASLKKMITQIKVCQHTYNQYYLSFPSSGIVMNFYCTTCNQSQSQVYNATNYKSAQCEEIRKRMALYTTPCQCGRANNKWYEKKYCSHQKVIVCKKCTCDCESQNQLIRNSILAKGLECENCIICHLVYGKKKNESKGRCYTCELKYNANIPIQKSLPKFEINACQNDECEGTKFISFKINKRGKESIIVEEDGKCYSCLEKIRIEEQKSQHDNDDNANDDNANDDNANDDNGGDDNGDDDNGGDDNKDDIKPPITQKDKTIPAVISSEELGNYFKKIVKKDSSESNACSVCTQCKGKFVRINPDNKLCKICYLKSLLQKAPSPTKEVPKESPKKEATNLPKKEAAEKKMTKKLEDTHQIEVEYLNHIKKDFADLKCIQCGSKFTGATKQDKLCKQCYLKSHLNKVPPPAKEIPPTPKLENPLLYQTNYLKYMKRGFVEEECDKCGNKFICDNLLEYNKLNPITTCGYCLIMSRTLPSTSIGGSSISSGSKISDSGSSFANGSTYADTTVGK